MTIPNEVDIIVCGGESLGPCRRGRKTDRIQAALADVLSLGDSPTWTQSSMCSLSRLERVSLFDFPRVLNMVHRI